MTKKDCNLDFANEIYRGASVALLSISDVLPQINEKIIKEEIERQYEGYRDFSDKIKAYMTEQGYEIKDVSKMKKIMMWSAIKMNTAFDGTTSHVATIMIKGTVMGITELTKILNESHCVTDEKLKEYAKELIHLEEEYEQSLKKFL
ncbi:MAG: hypothetical protein IKL82_02930 [Clostridia bacterium]|nr:hypothetical protein [Clostridia bacterium]